MLVIVGAVLCGFALTSMGERGRPLRRMVGHRAPPAAHTARGGAARTVGVFRGPCRLVVRDPALLADATKNKLEITPVSGEELTKIAKEVIDQPLEVVERIKKILAQ